MSMTFDMCIYMATPSGAKRHKVDLFRLEIKKYVEAKNAPIVYLCCSSSQPQKNDSNVNCMSYLINESLNSPLPHLHVAKLKILC